MWDLPGPGIEPITPALAGGFLTTGPPRKSTFCVFHLTAAFCPSSFSRDGATSENVCSSLPSFSSFMAFITSYKSPVYWEYISGALHWDILVYSCIISSYSWGRLITGDQ